MKKLTITLAAATLAALGSASTAQAGPTCSDLGWENHGDHIVNDYVRPGLVAGGAPAHRGHAPAPGASFCLWQAESPGFHVPRA